MYCFPIEKNIYEKHLIIFLCFHKDESIDRFISLKVNWSVDEYPRMHPAPPAASERACRTLTPPAGAAHVSFKLYPPPRSSVTAALSSSDGSQSQPLHMQAGRRAAHPPLRSDLSHWQ